VREAAGRPQRARADKGRSPDAADASCSGRRIAPGDGPGVDDQGPASSQGAHLERFLPRPRERVGLGRAERGGDDAGAFGLEDGIEGAGELGVSIADEEANAG
jgi:hypothetical protein